MPLISDYFGSDLSSRDYWRLEIKIHEYHRQDEVELQNTRWFDYRQLLPAHATYLFAEHYRLQYLEAYKRVKDIRTVDQISPFSPDDIFQSSELVAMWRCRREADRIGCKYDFYLRVAFNRFAARGWKHLPRPNQLYAEEISLEVEDAWKARCKDVLQLAEGQFFFHDSYIAHPIQQEYHSWVVGQIKVRSNKHLALSRVLKSNILTAEQAVREFGAEICKRAHFFAG